MYRESSGVLKREGAIDTSYSWEEEEIIDFYYKCQVLILNSLK